MKLLHDQNFIARIAILSIIVIALMSPQIQSAMREQTMFYPSGTMVITKPLVMDITSGSDIFYGKSVFVATLVFYNINPENYSYESFIEGQFQRADIHITFIRVYINETPRVYTDVQFEDKMHTIMTEHNSDFISVFANLKPNQDVYPNLIGFADLKMHFSIVFCPKLQSPTDWSAVQTHEIGHLMGLVHVDNPSCLMYKEYLYTNRYFCESDIQLLYTYHHTS